MIKAIIFLRKNKCNLVAPVGFEPTTLSLEVSCSIQLSYGAKYLFNYTTKNYSCYIIYN